MNKEIEVRFLDIDKKDIIKKLNSLKAINKGESLLQETIFYHKDDVNRKHNKKGFVRIRSIGDDVFMAFKERNIVKNKKEGTIQDITEIEIKIDNKDKAEKILQELNYFPVRFQEKKRHTFVLYNMIFDIDEWPKVPPYLEIEAETEQELKYMSQKLGLNWKNAFFDNAKIAIETYGINVRNLKYFTFDKIE